ncbi:MAG TPA: transposase [Candidatus Paceibacterota bacterium]
MRKVRFAPNYIYHVYNRGVEKRVIFLVDADRWRFLQALLLFNREKSPFNLLWKLEQEHGGRMNFRILKEFLERNSERKTPLVRIMADCLMPNHYHLILEELQEGGITKFMHKLGTGYTMYFNKKYDRVGGLFQGSFKAIQVDTDEYLQNLLVYVNVINPGELIEPSLKDEGVKDIENVMQFAKAYPWSTHQEYLGERDSPIIDKGVAHSLFPNPTKYKEFVENSLLTRKINTIEHLMLE